jgi:hypothetical protein
LDLNRIELSSSLQRFWLALFDEFPVSRGKAGRGTTL